MEKTGKKCRHVKCHSRCLSKLKKIRPGGTSEAQVQTAAQQRFLKVSVRLRRLILSWIYCRLNDGKKASPTLDFTWGQGVTDGLAWYDTRQCFILVLAAANWWMLASANISVENLILTETVFHIEENFCSAKKKKTFVTNFSAYGLVHVTFFIALDNFFHWNTNLSVSECCWLLAVESPCSGDSRQICLHFHLYSPLAIAQAFLHNFKNLSHFHVADDRIHYTMQRFF